jgi:nucleotide-binding universal stress UspA family protein
MLQKILIAIGDAPDSEKILESGLTLADKLGAQVLLLHVLNPLVPHDFVLAGGPLVGGILPVVDDQAIEQYLKEWQKYEKHGLERLQAYAQQASDRQIKAEIRQELGDSAPMICKAAQAWPADLIVIGRNQQSVWSEIFLGSTSNYVLHHASCSVMVIQCSSKTIAA